MIAKVLAAFEDEGASYVGFAADADGSEYVMLSLANGKDPQDKALGLDGLHLEINDQANGGYDLVRSVRIDSAGVTLSVDQAVRTDLVGRVRIELSPQGSDQSRVLKALREICRAAAVPLEDFIQ